MKKRFIPFVVLCLTAVLFSCTEKRKFNLPVRTLVIEGSSGNSVKVESELAVKTEERNYGFMNRKNIPDGTGMLFVFEKDQILNFWMKNTPHPLSIAYIDASGVITDILDMVPFSETSVTSSRSVRYALEVPKGWYKSVGVKVGDKVRWQDSNNQLESLKVIK